MKAPDLYKKVLTYYLSGTGNSFRISRLIGDISEEKGLNTIVMSVNEATPLTDIDDSGNCILGLVFPTHGFTAPWYIIKFACRLPRVKKTHAFCIATRAGLRFGTVFTPGIGGSATFLVAAILLIKGFRVQGVTGIDMPSNWYSFHPIQKKESISLIINRAKVKSSDFMNQILAGKKCWFTPTNLYEALWTPLLAIISLAYLFFGRFFLAKLFFANLDCDGCGICANNCPVNGIEMVGKQNPRPFWKYNCESCMRCAAFCPKKAIEAGHSWGVILWMITTVPVSYYLITGLNKYLPNLSGLIDIKIKKILDIIYFYSSLVLSYHLFQLLIKFKPFKLLFTWTTLTHLRVWGRYREPDTKLRQLQSKKKSQKLN